MEMPHIHAIGRIHETPRMFMDDGSVWEMRKQESIEPGSPAPELPYRWVLLCEGPKR